MAKCLCHICENKWQPGGLWFCKMASKIFGKDASNLRWRMWSNSLGCHQKTNGSACKKLCKFAEIHCVMPLMVVKNLWHPSTPLPASLSPSLSCFLSPPPQFSILLSPLTRILIFWLRNVSRKNHPSWREWTPDFLVTNEGLTHWAPGNGWS